MREVPRAARMPRASREIREGSVMTSTETTIVVPGMPEALEQSERRAARTLKSTVRDALGVMSEVLPLILSYRGGEDRIREALDSADTPECNEYRQRRADAKKLDEQADAEYEAAIAPFKAARDNAKAANSAALKPVEEAALESVRATVGDVPTVQENAENIADWTASVQQIRNAQQNAKRQLQLEFDINIPSLPGVRAAGTNKSDDPRNWRPRFSSVILDGTELGDGENPPTSGDVFGELKISRETFMSRFNQALGGDDVAQEKWNAMQPGDTLEVTFDVNKVGHPALFTKAEPISRKSETAPTVAAEQPAPLDSNEPQPTND